MKVITPKISGSQTLSTDEYIVETSKYIYWKVVSYRLFQVWFG